MNGRHIIKIKLATAKMAKAPDSPIFEMITPAIAGPMIRPPWNKPVAKDIPLTIACSGTNSGIRDCLAGISIASKELIKRAIVKICQTCRKLVEVNITKIVTKNIVKLRLISIIVRLLNWSAKIPPGSANTKKGRVLVDIITPSNSGESVSLKQASLGQLFVPKSLYK